MKNKVTRTGFALSVTLLLTACATATKPTSGTPSPQGAWASGIDAASCDTAPITYFSSDGVVLVLLSAEGPIHSYGQWTQDDRILTMTHNDFPVQADGKAKDPVDLEILTLTGERFDTKNQAGQVRERVRCVDIELKPNSDHAEH